MIAAPESIRTKHAFKMKIAIHGLKWTLLCGALFLFGCSLQEVSEKEMVGKYRLDLPQQGVALLTLNSDGSCEQVIHLSGKTYEASGTWEYFKKNQVVIIHGTRIALSFDDTISPDVFAAPPEINHAPSVVRSLFGGIQIMETEESAYQKID